MIYKNYIIPRHERTEFDIIADACWCVLSLLGRDYQCFHAMYGDPEYPEDGPEPRSNPHIKKLGSSERAGDIMRCVACVLQDAFNEVKNYDLTDWTVEDFHKWRSNGWNINEEWNKTD